MGSILSDDPGAIKYSDCFQQAFLQWRSHEEPARLNTITIDHVLEASADIPIEMIIQQACMYYFRTPYVAVQKYEPRLHIDGYEEWYYMVTMLDGVVEAGGKLIPINVANICLRRKLNQET